MTNYVNSSSTVISDTAELWTPEHEVHVESSAWKSHPLYAFNESQWFSQEAQIYLYQQWKWEEVKQKSNEKVY